MSFKAGKSSSQYVDLGLTGPPSPAKQESPVTRACKAILNVQIWPSFDVDLEREYSKSMLTHRIKTTLFYGFIWTGCILTTVVRFRNDPAFPAHVIIAAAFLLSCIPMLGLLPIPLRCIKAMSWCLKQPGCVWLMALVQLTLFLICVLWMSTTLASESTSTTTTHFLVLWLMTIIGTSGLFDLWTFVMLLIGTNIALFCTHPMMDKTVHYFIQGLGSVATIIATVQHDLLVRKLFLQGKRESQFLARMSHEIRTPLNGVVGFLQELRKTVLSSEQFEFVSAMSVAAENLQQVTDDILDHLKQQAGKIVSSLQPEHLQTVISDCVKMFQGRAAQKSLALSWSVMDGVPNCMMLDRLRIQQMLGNLISNAIKFTDKGSIEVSASVSGMQNGSLELRMAVKDTGIGISAKQRDRLFTPFNQADGSITRRYGGTGIGLSLVKGFAELMGGTAGCTSAGGGTGSTFWFTVHTKEAQAPREVWYTDEELEYPHGMRLMVVDDTKMNLELMKILINRWGCSGIYFESGPEAVSFVQQAEASQLPHVTFMDFHMPGMDGCETTRALLELKPDMPIIGLTADVTPECLESALKSGMQEVLPKPYKEKRLIHACRKSWNCGTILEQAAIIFVVPVARI